MPGVGARAAGAAAVAITSFSLKFSHYYVFHGRVTLFIANNFLTQRRITMKFLHNFF